jgi:predicted DNA-binding transcriptional regulator YafY
VGSTVTRYRSPRARSPVGRRPTYGAATRLARIVHGLRNRPYGWAVDAIQDELGISERTLLRYLAACRAQLVDERGAPILEIVRRGERRVVRLAESARGLDSSSFEVLFLYLALTVLDFLDGTVIREGVEGLWERFHATLAPSQQARLANFNRKFHSVPHMVKDYRGLDATLDTVVQCLFYQYRLRLHYRGLLGEGRVHEVEPYTLMMYRGGLYLIARSDVVGKIVYFAIERIARAEKLPQSFVYPKNYSPQKHTEGIFGIIEGPRTRAEILIHNAETAAYLRSRRLHPTQRFRRRRDGTTVLTMTVRGTTELIGWILSLGPYVTVLRPQRLRDEVQSLIGQAHALYEKSNG